MKRIHSRARSIETGITSDYLSLLETFYDDWLKSFDVCPVLTISSDDLDFVHKPQHLDIVIQRIQDRLAGKEELEFPSS
jgi:deoxyadenosine/deoxycytidine kinase